MSERDETIATPAADDRDKRDRRILAIVDRALTLEGEELATYLDETCDDDTVLRAAVVAILREGATADGVLEPGAALRGPLAEDLAAEASKALIGTTVSHYRILDELGGGGMGVVYRAEDVRLERTVALKFLPPKLYGDEKSKERFVREAKAASALDHPNICTIYDIGETDDGQIFIAMACYEGETLKHRLERGALGIVEAVDIVRQLASGLARTHERGLIHRDVKPANVFLTDDGQTKLLDFGLAKSAGDLDGLTRTGTPVGTPAYMSPEQISGTEVDARTDLWALGVLLYELLTGRQPFHGSTIPGLIYSIVSGQPETLAELRPDVPPELQEIASRLLQKDIDDRYPSCSELVEELDRLMGRNSAASGSLAGASRGGGADLSATTDLSLLQSDTARRSRRLLIAAFVALAAIVTAAIVVTAFREDSATPDTEDVAATPGTSPGLTLRQLTTAAGSEIFPAFSPDGGRLAYSRVVESSVDGSVHQAFAGFEIFVRPLTFGGREIQLTSDGQGNFEPAWSPDGELIAYSSIQRGGIWVVPALGGAPRRITDFGASPAWSPDGSSLVFQTKMGGVRSQSTVHAPCQLWRVDLEAGTPEPLTQLDEPLGPHASPTFSPNGKLVAFQAIVGDPAKGEDGLWLVSVEDGLVAGLETPCTPYDPVFSPAGELYFICRGDQGIWKIDLMTGAAVKPAQQVERLTGPAARHLDVGPQGQLAISRYSLNSNIWSLPLSKDTFLPTGPPVALTGDNNLRNTPLAFTLDGSHIAYQVNRAGSTMELWTMNATGTDQQALAQAKELSSGRVTWLAGGRELAYQSEGSWVKFDVETQRQEVIVEIDERWNDPQLSPNGELLTYSTSTDGIENVWILDIETGASRQLTFDPEFAGWPVWSPDSRSVAVEIRRDRSILLGVVSLEGDFVQLTFGEYSDYVWDWSPDGDKLIFARSDQNIWWVSVSDGTEQQVTSYTGDEFSFVRYPAWSPRGDQIVYEVADTASDIWLADLE